uniref:SFRICE_030047 n=1 Tax=Spodoptera frugiperda TaxID=7108 RepID=A0A2H1VX73_SPOFR
MKWLLITLALGLASSDKLDHTYLPPPGAQFAGGILGNQDAPLQPPHHTHPGTGHIIPGHEQHHPSLGVNGDPVNFGDKIPKVPFNYNQENLPTTTTSYAFSQTTTYPPTEVFNPANLPINPVTGLPILLEQGNIPFGSTQGQQNIQQLPGINQSQTPVYGTNVQPGVGPQGSNTINFDKPGFNQPINQISGQYPGQNLVNPGGVQLPGSVNQLPGQNQGQLPIGQGIVQQGLQPTGPTNQPFNQYPAQNLGNNNGGIVSIPGGNQGFVQYPNQGAPNQGLVPSTVSPINPQSNINQYGANYDGSQGPLTQGTYTGQPINVGDSQPTQTSYQNQGPFNIGGISQYSTERPDVSGPRGQGSTPSYYNGITSTTSYPTIPSSTSGYSSVRPVYRPERPQAEADRNAVILNYENVLTPNGYSYSFDTSNGIHADESGIVDNGTKAQGSYSYIGDDGKQYSVYYTADENGFRPRGDHLPTPPPIPEAIQRVIDQAAKDEAAGIEDDGSYDERKYGDDKYHGVSKYRRPQNQNQKTFNKKINAANDGLVKPITGIKDVEYDEEVSEDQFGENIPVNGAKKGYNNNLTVKRPSNENQGIRRISDNSGKPIPDIDQNGRPVDKQGTFIQVNNQKNQGTAGRPVSNENKIVFNNAEDEIDNKGSAVNNQGSSRRRPSSDGGKDTSVTKYPGANVDVTTTNYPKTESDGFENSDSQQIVSGKPGVSDEYDANENLEYDSVTGAPIPGGKKQTMKKRVKGNRRPGSNNQNENQNLPGRNDVQGNVRTPSISEYIENAAKQPITHQQTTKQDQTGYHYQQPSETFEQNTFPNRFRPQKIPTTMKPDERNTEYVEGTTRKPFITPNVYEQNGKTSPSTTRRPFMTKGVTSPSENGYTDYNDDDYATDLDVDNEGISATKIPFEKSDITSRPYGTTQKGSRPQYGMKTQQSEISQKQPLRPGYKIENTETVAPGYSYGPTSSPSHNSRFGTTQAPQNTIPDGRRPSTPNFESTTAVGRPVTQSSLGQTAPDYKYQSTGPNSKYFDSNVVSGYPTSGYTPGYGSTSGNPSVSTPQNYYTSTFRPSQGYSTTSALPTSGYQPVSGVQFPVGPTGSPVPIQDNAFQTGYHYEPPKSGSPSYGSDGGFFTPADNSRVSPTSPPGTYQTTYQDPGGFPSTTVGPSVGGSQDFIPHQHGSTPSNTSPIGEHHHQQNIQNQPSTPGYSTSVVSSTPGTKVTYDYPGSPNTYKDTTGFEYGPSTTYPPTYSTTNSPSTIGTTPGPYNPTGATIPSQGSSTYRPGFQNTEDLYVGGPVDGFGRPVPTNQGSNTGFTYPTQGPIGSYNGPSFGGNQPTTTYPGDQPRVIGEDFSGPKQPQRFDPETGYHYK